MAVNVTRTDSTGRVFVIRPMEAEDEFDLSVALPNDVSMKWVAMTRVRRAWRVVSINGSLMEPIKDLESARAVIAKIKNTGMDLMVALENEESVAEVANVDLAKNSQTTQTSGEDATSSTGA